jgi:hypothetical protein
MSETYITISCDTCAMRHTAACDDCVVTFLFERDQAPPQAQAQAIVLDLDEQRAVRLLAAAGLVPTLKHREAI